MALLGSFRKGLGVSARLGIIASSTTFYQGQERYETYSRYILRELRGSLREWQELNVLNYEMESAILLAMSNVLGLEAGCVPGMADNRIEEERINLKIVKEAEDKATRVAIKALELLISR